MSTKSIDPPGQKIKGSNQSQYELLVKIDGEQQRLQLNKLSDDEYASVAEEAITGAKGPVVVSLAALLDWPAELRLTALDFIVSLDANLMFYLGKDKGKTDDLFEAVLTLLVDNKDLVQFKNAKAAAMEVAVLMHKDALDGACDRIGKRLRELGVTGINCRDLLREARKIARELSQMPADPNENGGQAIIEVFADAPVSEDTIIPPRWSLTVDGIGRAGAEVTIRTPITITGRQVDINEGTELLSLAWRRDGTWSHRNVDRAAVASPRTIIDELAPYGIDVHSNNAKDVIQYLFDMEAANINHLPIAKVSHQLGWQGEDGKDGFLCGKTLISESVSEKETDDSTKQVIEFRGSDEGDDQIAAAFYRRGTMEDWLEAISPLATYPAAKVAFYLAFVPPLLPIFRSPNFACDFAGRTTGGKTTSSRVSGSVWGNPNEQERDSVVKTWDGTTVWRERLTAVTNTLPVYLDDTKHVRHKEEIASTVYQLVQGRSRGRGSVSGLRTQDTWQSVVLTTGEQSLTSFTEDGGTRARVLAFWGSPFGGCDPETGHMVRLLNEGVFANFGHGGPEFIQFLIDHRNLWDEWREEYRDELEKFQSWAEETDNPFAGRMAPHFAAIVTAAWLAHQALELPWDYEDPIEPLWDSLVQEAGEADRSIAALAYVMDWATSHQGEFYGRTHGNRQPPNGWAGRWDGGAGIPDEDHVTATWPWIAFIPAKLKAILREGGFEPESTIRDWYDKGWLLTSGTAGEKRRQYKTRVGSEKQCVWTIAITRQAIEKIWAVE